MHKTSTRNRVALLAAVGLMAGAVAVPTASACPLDPYDNCLVVSPDRGKVAAKAKGKKAFAPHIYRRGGR